MSQLSDAARRGRRRGPRLGLVLAGLLVVGALAYLLVASVRDTAVYSLTIAELQAMGPAALDRGVRVSGTVEAHSVSYDEESTRLAFSIREGERTLSVVYVGSRPEMLRDGAQVILEGRLSADGVLHATVLQLECPSKYEAEAAS